MEAEENPPEIPENSDKSKSEEAKKPASRKRRAVSFETDAVPCSSGGETVAAMADTNLDEALEKFAANYNLTAQNVKNIIYHIVKSPQTFATLIQHDPEAISGLRMTRSRLKELERISQTDVPIVPKLSELRPIAGPTTFLDVDYGPEDDDNDTDYVPPTLPALDSGEHDNSGKKSTDFSAASKNAAGSGQWGNNKDNVTEFISDVEGTNTATPLDEKSVVVAAEEVVVQNQLEEEVEEEEESAAFLLEEDREEEDPNNAGENYLYTHVDDLAYLDFVQRCLNPQDEEQEQPPKIGTLLDDDDDDDEYNVADELEKLLGNDEVQEEYRMDRTTEIPKWELRQIFDDFQPAHHYSSSSPNNNNNNTTNLVPPQISPQAPTLAPPPSSSTSTQSATTNSFKHQQGRERVQREQQQNQNELLLQQRPTQKNQNPTAANAGAMRKTPSTNSQLVRVIKQELVDSDTMAFESDDRRKQGEGRREIVDEVTGDRLQSITEGGNSGCFLVGRGDREEAGKSKSTTNVSIDGDQTENESTDLVIVQAESSNNISDPQEQSLAHLLPSLQTSCSLLEAPEDITFTEDELAAIRIQMEKHVQLLCQCIVGAYGDPNLIAARNVALNMLRELDAEMYAVRDGDPSSSADPSTDPPDSQTAAAQNNEKSFFHISTLPEAVFSSHDIIACQEVDLNLTLCPEYPPHHSPRSLSGPAMWVLSRSAALKYPELVPEFRFQHCETFSSFFLQSEDILLAIALVQLKNVKHSSWCNWNGRYQLAVRHFLPNKTVAQIRNHLKNIRSHPSPSAVQIAVMKAEKGLLGFDYHCENGAAVGARPEIPLQWPKTLQPRWLQALADMFNRGLIQVVMATVGEMCVDGSGSGSDGFASVEAPAPEETKNKGNRQTPPSEIPAETVESGATGDGGGNAEEIVEAREDTWREALPPDVDDDGDGGEQGEEMGEVEETEDMFVDVEAMDDDVGNSVINNNDNSNTVFSSSSTAGGAFSCGGGGEPNELMGENSGSGNYFSASTENSNSNNSNAGIPVQQITRGTEGTANTDCDGNATTATPSSASSSPQKVAGRKKEPLSQSAILQSQQQKEQRSNSVSNQRQMRGLQTLCCAPELRANNVRALAGAINEDMKQRLFIHQHKLRQVQKHIIDAELTTSEKMRRIHTELGDSHPQLFALLSALVSDEELSVDAATDPRRVAYRSALEMVLDLQSYLAGSRNATSMRNAFKFLRDAKVHSEEELIEALQQTLAKDDPIWRLLRKQMCNAKFQEKIEDWEFEVVELSGSSKKDPPEDVEPNDEKEKEKIPTSEGEDFIHFETITLPYNETQLQWNDGGEPERERLVFRHGRLTLERAGGKASKEATTTTKHVLVNVFVPPPIASTATQSHRMVAETSTNAQPANSSLRSTITKKTPPSIAPAVSTNSASTHAPPQEPTSSSSTPSASSLASWSREQDGVLLRCFATAGGDPARTIVDFLRWNRRRSGGQMQPTQTPRGAQKRKRKAASGKKKGQEVEDGTETAQQPQLGESDVRARLQSLIQLAHKHFTAANKNKGG